MKAIILSCDKYHIFAYHTIKMYEKLYPNHNFTFYIPWNNIKPIIFNEFQNKIILIKTPFPFKETIKELLKNIDDEEWIYWCSCDTYPLKINIEKMKKLEQNLNKFDKTISILPAPWKRRNITIKNNDFIEIDNEKYYSTLFLENGINVSLWFHQFMKSKLLKKLFECFKEPKKPKDLDYQIYNKDFEFFKFLRQFDYVLTEEPYCLFGENTSRGKITNNAYENMKILDINIPEEFKIMEKDLIWK